MGWGLLAMIRLHWATLLLTAVTLGACADAAKRGEDGEDAGPSGVVDPEVPACRNMFDDDADGLTDFPADPGCDNAEDLDESDIPTGPAPPGSRELAIIGDRSRSVAFDATLDLQVRYTDANGPIGNSRVTARLMDDTGNDRTAQGVEGSGLRSSNGITNADGVATFTVVAAQRAVTFRVQASAEGAAPVTWAVAVMREGAGALNITVTYEPDDNRYDFSLISSATVHLFDSANCEILEESALNLQGAYLSLPPLSPFNEVDNSTLLGDIEERYIDANGVEREAQFSIVAVAMGREVEGVPGRPLAFGCVDAVRVQGGQTTQVEVVLDDLPLIWKGNFVTVNKFDLTDLLRGTENETLERIADVLDILRILGAEEGRGEAVIRLICEIANVDESTCDIVDTLGAPFIDRALNRFLPRDCQGDGALCIVARVLTALSDVLTIASELTTVGEIRFTQDQADANGDLVGVDNNWQKFRFVWRNGCPQGEDCSREFTIGDLDRERRPISGTFDAHVEGWDMDISPHGLNFRYGLILVGLAEQWIIPLIANQPPPYRIEDMLADLIPCADINDFFGDPNSGLCEDVLVAALSDVIYDQLGRLQFEPEQFRLSGTALARDRDGDLVVDMLDEGLWAGVLTFGDTVLDFEGCFQGCRDNECEGNGCVIGGL